MAQRNTHFAWRICCWISFALIVIAVGLTVASIAEVIPAITRIMDATKATSGAAAKQILNESQALFGLSLWLSVGGLITAIAGLIVSHFGKQEETWVKVLRKLAKIFGIIMIVLTAIIAITSIAMYFVIPVISQGIQNA